MATNPTPIAPDALLKIVEQVKEYYREPLPKRQRGRPRTFSGLAFLLLAVVGVVLRTLFRVGGFGVDEPCLATDMTG